jgi:hypothetical protein
MDWFWIESTVKPVLRGQHLDKEKWSVKTGDLLKEVQLLWNLLLTGQDEGDLLIQVTA